MTLNGMVLVTPSSISHTGTSATINAGGSVSFTAVSVLSLNGVFSSTYDNYTIVAWATRSAGNVVDFRMRTAVPADDSSNLYYSQQMYATSTTAAGSLYYNPSTKGQLAYLDNALPTGFVCDIYGPYLAQPTVLRNVIADTFTNAEVYDVATTHAVSTAFPGISILPTSGTMTGRLAVYGMRK